MSPVSQHPPKQAWGTKDSLSDSGVYRHVGPGSNRKHTPIAIKTGSGRRGEKGSVALPPVSGLSISL